MDFDWEERDNVIHHLEDYYGKNHVAHIGTISALGVKSGISDVARVLGIDFVTTKNITKVIDQAAERIDEMDKKFKHFDELRNGDDGDKEAWNLFKEQEQAHPEIFRLARIFEGIPRNTGIHASGVLVTPEPITNYFPVKYVDGVAVTQYDGHQVEAYNGVKLDILGLKTLTIIKKALKNIDESITFEDLYNAVDLSDSKLYKYISQKQTDAVFQLESNLMKKLISDIKPTEFNDIVAINSIARPGPLKAGFGDIYSKVKNGKAEKEYPIRDCEDILDETYSVISYQEQLMAISKKVSGFNDNQADSITRKITA